MIKLLPFIPIIIATVVVLAMICGMSVSYIKNCRKKIDAELLIRVRSKYGSTIYAQEIIRNLGRLNILNGIEVYSDRVVIDETFFYCGDYGLQDLTEEEVEPFAIYLSEHLPKKCNFAVRPIYRNSKTLDESIGSRIYIFKLNSKN